MYEPETLYLFDCFHLLLYFPLCELVFICLLSLSKIFISWSCAVDGLIGLLRPPHPYLNTRFASFKQTRKQKKYLNWNLKANVPLSDQVFQTKWKQNFPVLSSSKKAKSSTSQGLPECGSNCQQNVASCLGPAPDLTANAGTGWLADSHWRRSYTHLPYETAWRPARRLDEGWP